MTSRDVIFDLSEKMAEILPVDLLPSFRMPFAASRYLAWFSRSPGGGRSSDPPPPLGAKLAQTPVGARVKGGI